MLASIAIASCKMSRKPQRARSLVGVSVCCMSFTIAWLVGCLLLSPSGGLLILPPCMLAGVAQGTAMLGLAELLGSCRTRNNASVFALCLCVAFASAWVISFLGPLATNIVAFLVALAGYALLVVLRKSIPEDMQLPRGEGVSIIRTRTSVALSSQTLFGLFVGIGLCGLDLNVLPFAFSGILTGAMLTAIVQWGSKGAQLNPATVQRGTYSLQLVSCVSLLACCALGNTSWGVIIAALLSSLALSALLIFNWNTLVVEMREFALAPYPHFARGFIGIWTGCALGLGVIAACLLAPDDMTYTVFIATATILAAAMIVTAFVCKPDETEDLGALGELLLPKPQEGVGVPSGQTIEDLCAHTGRRHGLTAREHEVLVFLARGRNATFIQKELCISFSTAKTHIYHIYQKLGVSSQQQLIDLVDSENL